MRRTPRAPLMLAVATLALALGAGAAAAHGFGGDGGGLKGTAAALALEKGARRRRRQAARHDGGQAERGDQERREGADRRRRRGRRHHGRRGPSPEGGDRRRIALRAGLGRASVVAKALGTTTAKLNEAYREARQAQALARVDQALKDGDLDEDEAAELKKEIEDADFPGYSGGRGFGLGHRGGFGGPGGGHGFGSDPDRPPAVESPPRRALDGGPEPAATLTEPLVASHVPLRCARSNGDIAATARKGARR